MGIHDSYGKVVLDLATNKRFQHWCTEKEQAFEYPSGGIIAKLDGVVGDDCVVEVEGLNEKQIRGGILDLVFHPRPKKLSAIVPPNLGNKSADDVQHAYQSLLDNLLSAYHPSAIGRVIVLGGTGHDQEDYLQEDASAIHRALRALGVTA